MGTPSAAGRLPSPAFLPGIPAPQLLEAVERVLAGVFTDVNARDRGLIDKVATELERALGLSHLLNEAAAAARILEDDQPLTAARLRIAVERFSMRRE